MNITLSADVRLVERAREYAAAHGTSLNQLVRDYLERLVGVQPLEDAAAEFARRARTESGSSGAGPRIRREDIYADRLARLERPMHVSDPGSIEPGGPQE
ncbi:MAG: DUF6364 family protein [Phycisphaerae bacterium]